LGYVEAVTINSILVKKLNIAVVIVAFYQLVGGTTAIKLAFKGSAVSCRGSREVAGGIIPPAISHLAVATPRKLALRSQK
jgi:hypothetical protein